MTAPLVCLLLAAVGAEAGAAAARQHNLFSVNDFLSQLGALATASQGLGGGGGPSNYLSHLLQAYQRPTNHNRPYPQGVPQGYPQGIPQGYPQGFLQGYPQGFPQGYPQGLPQGYPQGVPQGYPQGVPQGYLQGFLQGPQRPVIPENHLQDLQYQQNQGQDPNGGFGLRPSHSPPVSLTTALQSVARYDDARCVPRLLCELTAGGRPGQAKQNQALPFVNRDTLVSLLTVLSFGSDSPLLVFGRAALLGYMAQGDPQSCLTAYPTCPRDADRLVDYLNNHNGGFFRFFTGVGNPQYQGYRPPGTLYAPQYRDYAPGNSIAFPEGKSISGEVRAEARILTKVHPMEAASSSFTGDTTFSHYLPTPRPDTRPGGHRAGRKHNLFKFPNPDDLHNAVSDASSGAQYHQGNDETVFVNGQAVPQQYLHQGSDGDGELATFTLDDGEYTFTNPYTQQTTKGGDRVKAFTFPAIRVGTPTDVTNDNGDGNRPYIPHIQLQKPAAPVMIFPTRTGTGELRLDPVEHLKLAQATRKPFTFAQNNVKEQAFQQEHVVHGMYSVQQEVGGLGQHGHAFRFPADGP